MSYEAVPAGSGEQALLALGAATHFDLLLTDIALGAGIRGTELAANPRDDKLYLKPYVILDKKIKDGSGAEQPIRIGIIGFVPPQVMVWDLKNLEGNVKTRDIVEAAKASIGDVTKAGTARTSSGRDA